MRRSEVLGQEAIEASRENATKESGLEGNQANCFRVKPDDTGRFRRINGALSPAPPETAESKDATTPGA